MMNKRLLRLMKESLGPVKTTVLLNLGALVMNIIFITGFVRLLNLLFSPNGSMDAALLTAAVMLIAVLIRAGLQKKSAESAYYASRGVKLDLRRRIYQKLMELGTSYQQQCSTSEVVQVAMEGVEQLEIYFSRYLPQLFTSLITPLILFVVLLPVDWKAALVLLVCVPLIPISIIAVQKFAKKLLARYWGAYTGLGDSFLESLQGLTTLKIYQADERQTEIMDREAEHFRRITMKVLTMQLNSISVMDLVAYGGAAVGMLVALLDFRAGSLSFAGCLLILLLASEFFIPLRLLGSFFHIAMNGMAASDKIFRLLDLPVPERPAHLDASEPVMELKDLSFSYDPDRPILNRISMQIPHGSFIGLAGQSGCGKSTLAAILSGSLHPQGQCEIAGLPLDQLDNLAETVTLIHHQQHLFKGTVRENLNLADPQADEKRCWEVLRRVNLEAFLKSQQGLDTPLSEGAANLSGGQRQRLSLARALLKDTPVMIFDEATSNIDIESENDILNVIRSLKGKKTVIMISHRLDYCADCDRIFVLENGTIQEAGTHTELMKNLGPYHRMIEQQRRLMSVVEGGAA